MLYLIEELKVGEIMYIQFNNNFFSSYSHEIKKRLHKVIV